MNKLIGLKAHIKNMNKRLGGSDDSSSDECTGKCTDKCTDKYTYTKKKKKGRSGCWRADHLILTDKGFIRSDKLTKHDIIMTPTGEKTKINKIIKYTGTKKICNINNIELTHGVPKAFVWLCHT